LVTPRSGRSRAQFVEQRLGVLQIGGVEAFLPVVLSVPHFEHCIAVPRLEAGKSSIARRQEQTDSRTAPEGRRRVAGPPRIHGELLMLGIEFAESTVGRYYTVRIGSIFAAQEMPLS